MNTFTKVDIQEIETRINNKLCPFCGGQSIIKIEYKSNVNQDLFFYDVTNLCCHKYKENANQLLKKEYEYQMNIKISRIMNM